MGPTLPESRAAAKTGATCSFEVGNGGWHIVKPKQSAFRNNIQRFLDYRQADLASPHHSMIYCWVRAIVGIGAAFPFLMAVNAQIRSPVVSYTGEDKHVPEVTAGPWDFIFGGSAGEESH